MNNKTILQCIKNNSIKYPEKMAVACIAKELTYKEYWDKICIAATYLKNKKVIKGEYIIIKAVQSVDFLIVCHAIQLSGAVCVPVEKSINSSRLQELLEVTNCNKYFADIQIEGVNALNLEDAVNYKQSIQEWDMPLEEDEAMVLFTTGTTGKSKGIVLNYLSEYAVAENVLYGVEMKEDNIEVIPMPMNHSFSLRRYFANMVNSSSVIVIDGVFFVKVLFEIIEKYKVTSLAMAPAAMGIILKLTKNKIANYNEQLDYIQFGAAPITQADKDTLINLLPNVRLYNIYGSTEYGCACCLNFNSKNNKQYCIGYPTKNSKFLIVDENYNEIKNATAENPGYLSWAGSMGMNCYFKDEALTQQTVINGYLKTNDLGYKDKDGMIYMLGRADDVIISGGNKISPIEVEEVVCKFPGIIDCICKKQEDALLGYVPVLYIVADKSISIKDLDKHLMNFLEDFKRPRSIQFIESVPRTYNNKIDRKVKIEIKE